MSESQEQSQKAASDTPATSSQPPSSGGIKWGSIGVGTLISAALGVLGAAAGAGWPGVVALAAVGISIPMGWSYFVNIFNNWVDKKDQASAASDSGNTVVDLQNQGQAVSDGLDSAQKADAPTDGFPNKS